MTVAKLSSNGPMKVAIDRYTVMCWSSNAKNG